MKKAYKGWIFMEKIPGLKDGFSVQYRSEDHNQSLCRHVGYGEIGAEAAVEFFESKHGPVKLEQTPIGLRVYIEID